MASTTWQHRSSLTAAVAIAFVGIACDQRPNRAGVPSANLKKIGIALHQYHDNHQVLPVTVAVETKPHHSWQSALLPYLKSRDDIPRIDFRQPWDATDNRSAFQTHVDEFINPSLGEASTSDGLSVTHYAGSSRLFSPNAPRIFREMTDGLSNTIAAGDVSVAMRAWGDPRNIRDPAAGISPSASTFGRRDSSGATFLLADGSVRSIRPDIEPGILYQLATIAGGEVVGESVPRNFDVDLDPFDSYVKELIARREKKRLENEAERSKPTFTVDEMRKLRSRWEEAGRIHRNDVLQISGWSGSPLRGADQIQLKIRNVTNGQLEVHLKGIPKEFSIVETDSSGKPRNSRTMPAKDPEARITIKLRSREAKNIQIKVGAEENPESCRRDITFYTSDPLNPTTNCRFTYTTTDEYRKERQKRIEHVRSLREAAAEDSKR